MTHDQKEWAKSQPWFITAAKTLSGNWIIYITPKDGETPDIMLTGETPAMQCADYPMLLAWAGLVDSEARDLASLADEIKGVAGEYIDEHYDELTVTQRACLFEITTSLSASNARVIELWTATGLNY